MDALGILTVRDKARHAATSTLEFRVDPGTMPGLNPFGAGFFRMPTDTAIQRAISLGVRFFRLAAFLGGNGGYQHPPSQIRDAGLVPILNVVNVPPPPPGSDPGKGTVPTDFGAYEAAIERAIVEVEPFLVCVENELPWKWQGTANDYGRMIASARRVTMAHGVKLAGSGTISATLAIWLYWKLASTGRQADADAIWAAGAHDPGQAKPTSVSQTPPAQEYFIRAEVDNGVDYGNGHYYWSSAAGLTWALPEIAAIYGVPFISNEWGWNSFTDGTGVSAAMDVFLQAQTPVAHFFSADTGDYAKSLFNPDGTLRPIGEAFKSKIAAL